MGSKRRSSSRRRRRGGRVGSSKDWLAITASFFAIWAMTVCPLYLEDQYFNLRQSKGHAYIAGAVITLVLLVIAAFKEDEGLKPLVPKKDVTDISIVVFGVLGFVSTCFSGYFYNSFVGNEGWWFGGFQQLTFLIFIMLLSKKLDFTNALKNVMLIVGYIVFFIGIMHSMNIDMFFLHKNTASPFAYISTMGNVNWYVGYLCLTVPIFAVLFMNADEKKEKIQYGIYMFLACMGIVTCKSDGTYVGIGMCAIFAIPFVMSTAQRFSRFMMCVGFFGLSNLIVSTIPAFAECKAYFDGIPKTLLDIRIAIPLMFIGAVGYFLADRFYPEDGGNIRRIGIIALEVCVALGVLYFVIDMIRNWGPGWGSRRGEIWMNAIDVFKQTPFHQKLIGTGPETLFVVNAPYSQARGELVLANHSDYFQLFTTNGLIGLGAWLTMWVSIVVKFAKSKNIEGKSYMFLLPLMAYMGQALINTMESMVLPMVITLISLYLRYYRIEQEELELDE